MNQLREKATIKHTEHLHSLLNMFKQVSVTEISFEMVSVSIKTNYIKLELFTSPTKLVLLIFLCRIELLEVTIPTFGLVFNIFSFYYQLQNKAFQF